MRVVAELQAELATRMEDEEVDSMMDLPALTEAAKTELEKAQSSLEEGVVASRGMNLCRTIPIVSVFNV